MNVPYTSLDALKYLEKRARGTLEWSLDGLSLTGISSEDHAEVEALNCLQDELNSVLGPLVEQWNHYSDGRQIATLAEIEPGSSFEHLWHPDPTKNTTQVVTGDLRKSDDGEGRGSFEAHIEPPQTLRVVLLPTKARLQIVGGGS